ncbi:ferroxidase fet3, partial [Podochytrium sp. JEL0797]
MYHGDPWTSIDQMPRGFNPIVLAILNYKGINPLQPPTTPPPHSTPPKIFGNTDDLKLTPLVDIPAPSPDATYLYQFDFQTRPGDTYQKAYNTISRYIPESHTWSSPLVNASFYQPATPPPLLLDAHAQGLTWRPRVESNTIWLNHSQKVVDFLIRNDDPGEHPFHIHGHVFWVLDAGVANSMTRVRRRKGVESGVMRRDVVTVSACPHDEAGCLDAGEVEEGGEGFPADVGEGKWFGYALIRIVADNPG